jgi:DNA primase
MSDSQKFVDFRAIKSAVGMQQVLDRYNLTATLTRGKDGLTGPCPMRKTGGPAQMRVSLTGNYWGCLSDCRCGGSVIDFVARMEGVAPAEAAVLIARWFGLDAERPGAVAPQPGREVAARPGTQAPPGPARAGPGAPEEAGENRPLPFRLELDPSHPYLAERGLSPATAAEFGMGLCARGVMAGRVAIPISDAGGRLVGYAGRWPGEPPAGTPKYRLPDGFRRSLEVYRLAEALREPPGRPWVIVGGYFDAARFWQLGIRRCVAVMGSSMSQAQEAILSRHLSPTSQAVVVLNEDEAGRRGREDIVRRLSSRAFVRLVTFPEDGFRAEHLTAETAAELGLIGAP